MKTTTAAQNSETWKHPFERAGLGIAPFRCVGYSVEKYQAAPGAPIQPGASCDYCGAGIMRVYRIVGSGAADVAFKVGCDCVARTKDTALSEAIRREQRKAERAERDAAFAVWLKEEGERKTRERAERAAWNLENMSAEIDMALVVAESINASEYERTMAERVYQALVTGAFSGLTDRERQILTIAHRAALLPVSVHMGKMGERLRGIKARYEGGPTIGVDSIYGPSVLAKFRVTEGANAGVVLIWKTKYHPAKRGSIVTLMGTVAEHSAYAGVQQTKVTRCKVDVTDESECVDVG